MPERSTPPEGAPKYAPTTWGELRQYRDMPQSGPVSDEEARALIHGYFAAVSFMDAQLGRVLDELDRLDLTKNTVILLWGDHGWHLGDHGMWCKHSNYEQANRIPLIVSAPGVTTPGSRTGSLAETVDIYPTLCELAGLPRPEARLDGLSLVPILKNPAHQNKPAVFHVFPRGRARDGAILGRAVRTDRYRLVEWKKPGAPPDTAEFELYDYQSDPGETRNHAADQPEIVRNLQAVLIDQGEAVPQIGRRP